MKRNLGIYLILSSLLTISSFADQNNNNNNILIDNPNLITIQDLGINRNSLLVNSFKVTGINNLNLGDFIEELGIKKGDVFNQEAIKQAASKLLQTGYFTQIIPTVTNNAKDKTVDIILDVKENPIINSVKIVGATLFTPEQLMKVAGLKKGQVLNLHSINPQTSPIIGFYQKNGVLSAAITGIEEETPGNFVIKISEGKVTKIEYIKTVQRKDNRRYTEGNSVLKTKPYVLERATSIKVGNILTVEALNNTISNLFRTGLFSQVVPNVEQDPNDPNGRIVILNLQERPTTSISAQVSYETSAGFTGGLKLADTNFLGNQQNASIGINFGTKGSFDLAVNFFDPWIKGTKQLQLGGALAFNKTKASSSSLDQTLSLEDSTESNNNIFAPVSNISIDPVLANLTRAKDTYTYKANLSLGKGFFNSIYLNATPSISYTHNKSAQGGLKNNQYAEAAIGLGLTYDTRNDPNKPESGFDLNFTFLPTLRFADKSLNGDLLKKDIIIAQKYINFYGTNDKLSAFYRENPDAQSKVDYENYNSSNSNEKIKNPITSGISYNEENFNTLKGSIKKQKEFITEKLSEDDKWKNFKYTKTDEETKLPTELADTISKYNLSTKSLTNFYFKTSLDLKAFHPIIKGKNSNAYRINFSYASTKTPDNNLYQSDLGGTTLRGYNPQSTNMLFTTTVENRTYLNDYVQLVAFGEFGLIRPAQSQLNLKPKFFAKENTRLDFGVGTRITTPIGVIRLDYAWPVINIWQSQSRKSGRFSFGFGQSF